VEQVGDIEDEDLLSGTPDLTHSHPSGGVYYSLLPTPYSLFFHTHNYAYILQCLRIMTHKSSRNYA
jgi:hypothetical protein